MINFNTSVHTKNGGGWMPTAKFYSEKRSRMPVDYLKETEVLQTILYKNFAEGSNELRPLKDYKMCMRDWGRDYLKAFLSSKGIKLTQSEILDFEKHHYGLL